MDLVAGGSDAAPEMVDALLPAPLAVRRWRRIMHMADWDAAERRARRLARTARRASAQGRGKR